MGKKHKHKADGIEDGFGPGCPRCGETMIRLVHSPNFKPTPGRWYLAYWWRCVDKACATKQVNPKADDAWCWPGPGDAPSRGHANEPEPTSDFSQALETADPMAELEDHFRSI